ncbi:MAG: hypothetical protein AAB295_00940, partial [Chloroflexota bacterium]
MKILSRLSTVLGTRAQLALRLCAVVLVHVPVAILIAVYYRDLAFSIVTLLALPISVTAWLLGARIGVAVALVDVLLLNPAMRGVSTGSGFEYLILDFPPALAGSFLAAVAGTLRDLRACATVQTEALQTQTDLYEGLLAAQGELGEAVVILEGTASENRIVFANEGLSRLTGYTVNELGDLSG